jgi:hypothetical protein
MNKESGRSPVIATCARCGVWGEVRLQSIPNGGQPLLCFLCASTDGPSGGIAPGRLSDLVHRWRAGSITPAESSELDQTLAALVATAARTGDASRASTYALVRTRLKYGEVDPGP